MIRSCSIVDPNPVFPVAKSQLHDGMVSHTPPPIWSHIIPTAITVDNREETRSGKTWQSLTDCQSEQVKSLHSLLILAHWKGRYFSTCSSWIKLLVHHNRFPSRTLSSMSSKIDSGRKPTSEPGEGFYYAVQPNQMTYVDDKGVSRSIHIPRGKNQEACDHFANEDWKALSLFPTWSMYAMLRSSYIRILWRMS